MKRFGSLILVGAVSMVVVAGCGGGSNNNSNSKLTIVNVSGSTWTCGFNPFNSAVLGPGITYALAGYEPLEFSKILHGNNPPKPIASTRSQRSSHSNTLS